LTGRDDYIQPSIQPNKLRKKLTALHAFRSNDVLGVAYAAMSMYEEYVDGSGIS